MPPAVPLRDQPPPKSGPREEPLRRRRAVPPEPAPSSWKRRTLNIVLGFVTVVLVVDALVGNRGLIEMIRARRQWRAAEADLGRIRHENEGLREQARRLKDDPATIESLARQELGLIRPGEVLFILKEPKPVRR